MLLVLPFLVLVGEYAPRREYYWSRHDSMADVYEVPRLVLAGVALAAAVFLRRRHGRATGVALGSVAVFAASVVAVASSDRWYVFWPRYGAFGPNGWTNAAWLVLTGASLALVPRRIEPVAARHAGAGLRGAVRLVPRVLPLAAAIALLALTWEKLQTIGDHGCGGGNAWRDTDILLTTADLWAAGLVLVPGTRRTGLRFAVLLFEATTAWICGQWLRLDERPDRFVGLGALEGSWAIHATIAAVLALGFAAAYLRELHVHAAGAFARHGSPAPQSRVPALLVRLRAFRRFHRGVGARHVWAALVGAAGLAVLAATTMSGDVRAALVPFVYGGTAHRWEAGARLGLAATQLVAAAWMLRADRRGRGALLGVLTIAAGLALRLASMDELQEADPLPAVIWIAVGGSCAMSASGLAGTDVRSVLRRFGRVTGWHDLAGSSGNPTKRTKQSA